MMLVPCFIGVLVLIPNSLSVPLSNNTGSNSTGSNSTASNISITLRTTVKYADDCTLPENWRTKGLDINPTNYLSYLERRVKSGYSVSVTCASTAETFTTVIRSANAGIGTTIDTSGYVKIYCDTNAFSPNIFKDGSGKEYSTFCEVGCTDLPLDTSLYTIKYPTNSSIGSTPVKYIPSLNEFYSWGVDPSTAISISCIQKFTRPVSDEGVAAVRCKETGGYSPPYSEVHSCKPGCPDWTINNLPALITTKDSKAVATRAGNPPFAFSTEETDAITFKCLTSWKMILKGEEVDQSVHYCNNAKKGWWPNEKPYCVFSPSRAGQRALSVVVLGVSVILMLA